MHTVKFKIECLALLPVSFWFVLNVLKSAKKRTIFSSHFNRGANQNKLHRPLQKPHAHVPTRSNRLIPISRASEPSSCHNLIIIILPPLEALCRVQFMHRKQKIYDNKLRKLTEERARKRLASAPNYKLRNLQQLPRNYNFAPRWPRKNETFFCVVTLKFAKVRRQRFARWHHCCQFASRWRTVLMWGDLWSREIDCDQPVD